MKVRLTAGLGLTQGLCMGLTAVHADDFDWRPTSAPPAVARAREVVASTEPPAATLGRPIVSRASAAPQVSVKLGAPTAVEDIQPITYTTSLPVYRGQAPDSVPPPPVGVGAVPPPPLGAVPGGDLYSNGVVTPTAPGGNFFTQGLAGCKDSFTRRCGQPFMSDHGGELNEFCSPVTSPFLTVDPRALTEVKPLFIYQNIPNNNPVARGGSVEFFAMTGSVA